MAMISGPPGSHESWSALPGTAHGLGAGGSGSAAGPGSGRWLRAYGAVAVGTGLFCAIFSARFVDLIQFRGIRRHPGILPPTMVRGGVQPKARRGPGLLETYKSAMVPQTGIHLPWGSDWKRGSGRICLVAGVWGLLPHPCSASVPPVGILQARGVHQQSGNLALTLVPHCYVFHCAP